MNKYLKLAGCLLLPLIVGGVSGYLSGSGLNSWFDELVKPPFNPPAWVFGPVWTLLYLLMGVSLFRILQVPDSQLRSSAIVWFFIQLTLNFMWSVLFFRWHQLSNAFAEILVLWMAIIIMLIQFKKTDRIAFLLQIPYLIWVTFASFLSGAFWILNR